MRTCCLARKPTTPSPRATTTEKRRPPARRAGLPERARALAALPLLPIGERITALELLLKDCARGLRTRALEILAQLAPELAEIGDGEPVRGFARALTDVGRW